MKEFSWMKIVGICVTVSIIVGMIGGALTNEYFVSYIFSRFNQNQEENAPIVKKVIEERTFVEESLVKDAFDKIIPSVVALYSTETEIEKADRENTKGTGFFITTDGLIATCKSITSNQKMLYVQANDEQIYKADIVYTDPLYDLAFFKVERNDKTPFFKAVDFAQNIIAISQKVLVVGIDTAFNQHVKSGIVSFTGSENDLKELDFQINQYVNCGPVVNLGGEVHGLALNNKTGITYVIPVEYLNQKFLEFEEKL